MYNGFKISKDSYEKSKSIQDFYTKLSNWCNKTGQYTIEDGGDCYVVKENPLYEHIEGQDFKTEVLNAQFEDATTENITPTTYLNVMIKL